LLREQAITVVTLPPTVLAALPIEDLPALRVITAAGEACPSELVRRSKGKRFFNLYGPTEATIWATVADCTDTDEKPPIGRPIPNTRIYVLDAAGEPTPIGAPGELHIGGVGVARGYLNQPELSAAKFVADPFSGSSRDRLYKTGDLARYLSDGRIEFLGRIDDQVKIRGLRIEPGEIEAALRAHPQVRDATVVLREDVPQMPRLVAYVVGDPEVPNDATLRQLLRQRLPEYMVPAAFVRMEALPLTLSGKVDRRRLPAPEAPIPQTKSHFVAPRSDTELQVARIWSEVLNVESPGVNDNFFDFGGHSLLATQLVSRAGAHFGFNLSLRAFFDRPTIAALAEEVATARWSVLAADAESTIPDGELEQGAI
jgi:non-ribosomal peptide synthetase component F